MAWLANTLPSLSGSGIIYTLTQRDAERVSEWLQTHDLHAKAYHADISGGQENASVREELERQLLNNEIKALVATVALGMGFDKPDLGFVIHFQRPASVVHYYQQVGRAGRALEDAYGILMCGEEDDAVADYFIRNAFPPQQHISAMLRVLEESDSGLSIPSLQGVLNLRKSQIEKTLQFLAIESPSPIVKVGSKWQVTSTASSYQVDQRHVDAITEIRRREQQQMRDYMEYDGCLMAFLQSALDDPTSLDCNKCANCRPDDSLDVAYENDLANQAGLFLRRCYQRIQPRKRWPAKDMFHSSPLSEYRIADALQPEAGRALSLWRDAGWGQAVAHGKYQTGRFPDSLVTACVEMLQDWSPDPTPKWVTCVPSLRHPALVPDFAARLAVAIGLPFVACIEIRRANRTQKEMENSYQQVRNLDGVFRVTEGCLDGECLLVDDMVDSGWTLTVISALLRLAGCSAVYPLALALNSPRMD
jgi:ATP-dependent DNA helicase RecQ